MFDVIFLKTKIRNQNFPASLTLKTKLRSQFDPKSTRISKFRLASRSVTRKIRSHFSSTVPPSCITLAGGSTIGPTVASERMSSVCEPSSVTNGTALSGMMVFGREVGSASVWLLRSSWRPISNSMRIFHEKNQNYTPLILIL